ncbi:hypothetical protein P12x_004062 [Tundrisphaera lichenicola]|uniref:hypothetical protein n=1 Tax=Tundrisphaera lichenicola TaxID=2029860 RepID=UPI003EBF949B
MSSGNDPSSPEADGLQFIQAEYDQAPPSVVGCAACKQTIIDQYFEINGTIVCEPCKQAIESKLRDGSGAVRFFRSLAFGTGAGMIGTLAYVASIRITHYDLSLISIFVGYLIGRAVRVGSDNRGGLIYQMTAIFLTYLAIGATYVSLGFLENNQAANPIFQADIVSQAILFVFLTIIVPVASARESVISVAIIGFALWQAWKMNVKLKLIVTGPYLIEEGESESSFDGTTDHA